MYPESLVFPGTTPNDYRGVPVGDLKRQKGQPSKRGVWRYISETDLGQRSLPLRSPHPGPPSRSPPPRGSPSRLPPPHGPPKNTIDPPTQP